METVLAFDIGGTWLKIAEVNRQGEVIWGDRIAPARDYQSDLKLFEQMAKRRTQGVVAAAFVCPGPLDYRTGQVIKATNLNWVNVYPGRDLEDLLQIPVVVENDADSAALSEAVYGDGRESQLLLYYGLGTGVGAGIVEKGKIFHGAFDPEFGHQILEPRIERYCTAGHRGCLEALISGGALEREFGSIQQVPDEQWQDVIPHYLGQAFANATLFVSPDVIVIGGGVVDHRPDIVPPAIREMVTLLNDFVAPPRVMTSELGAEVGILGAAAVAWQLRDRLQSEKELR